MTTVSDLPTFAGHPTYVQQRQRALALLNEAMNVLMAECRVGAGPSSAEMGARSKARGSVNDAINALRRGDRR